jgi:hypothetical protein
VERTLGPGARAFLGLCSVASMLALALSLPASAAYMQLLLLAPSVAIGVLFCAFAGLELALDRGRIFRRAKMPAQGVATAYQTYPVINGGGAGNGGPSVGSSGSGGSSNGAAGPDSASAVIVHAASAGAGASSMMRCCPSPVELIALALSLVHPLCGGALLALLPVTPSRENVMGRQWRWALAHAGLQVVPALFLLSRAQSSPRALAFVPECLVAPLITALLAAAQMVRNRRRRLALREARLEAVKLEAEQRITAEAAARTAVLTAALEEATRARARAIAPYGISGSEGPSLEAGGSDRRFSAVTFSVDADLSDESEACSLSEEPGQYGRGFDAHNRPARVPTDSTSAYTTRRPSKFSTAFPEGSVPSDSARRARVDAAAAGAGATGSVGADINAGSSTGTGAASGAADSVDAGFLDATQRMALIASGGARSGLSPPRAK